MTAHQLLMTCRQAGIVLAADGDCLDVDAPAGVLTPELRDELSRQKPALLSLLAPVVTELVYLRGGLLVPRPALELVLDLEARGFKMTLDEHQQFAIGPPATLTPADRAAIQRWRIALGAIVGYQAPVLA
jgi:hypothetical protein